MFYDIAIIGGGPAASTIGSLLKKYNSRLSVGIFEREDFPRDHVGESQLPGLMPVLAEMGVWEKVEAADFPVKIGGTYRWGKLDELWDFEFLPGDKFEDLPRPGKYAGQRRETAFQVDRSIYDKVLLDHAKSLGCEVFEGTRVVDVQTSGDRVTGFTAEPYTDHSPLGEAQQVTARHYVDASGDVGLLRRAMGIEVDAPTALKNIAIYDYWQDAEWAVTLGCGGTRIQVMSLGWGWIWFIPITPTRTSIGLVVPAEYFKSTGKSTEEIYRDAVASEPLISHLVRNATRENKLRATKDWSFIAQRLTGENWFLAGDACGFADPILSAGLTLAQAGGRKVAYSILELERGQFDADWIKREYERSQSAQIRSHIQFADYWYTANGRFTDLEDYCSEIARTAGLELNSKDAFRWLAAGGFASEDPGVPRASTFRVGSLKFIEQLFSGSPVDWAINRNNVFKLDLEGAERDRFAMLVDGRIKPIECYQRDGKVLPLANVYSFVFAALRKESDGVKLVDLTVSLILSQRRGFDPHVARGFVMEALEAMIAEGWVAASVNEQRPFLKFILPEEGAMIHRNRDNVMV